MVRLDQWFISGLNCPFSDERKRGLYKWGFFYLFSELSSIVHNFCCKLSKINKSFTFCLYSSIQCGFFRRDKHEEIKQKREELANLTENGVAPGEPEDGTKL